MLLAEFKFRIINAAFTESELFFIKNLCILYIASLLFIYTIYGICIVNNDIMVKTLQK